MKKWGIPWNYNPLIPLPLILTSKSRTLKLWVLFLGLMLRHEPKVGNSWKTWVSPGSVRFPPCFACHAKSWWWVPLGAAPFCNAKSRRGNAFFSGSLCARRMLSLWAPKTRIPAAWNGANMQNYQAFLLFCTGARLTFWSSDPIDSRSKMLRMPWSRRLLHFLPNSCFIWVQWLIWSVFGNDCSSDFWHRVCTGTWAEPQKERIIFQQMQKC